MIPILLSVDNEFLLGLAVPCHAEDRVLPALVMNSAAKRRTRTDCPMTAAFMLAGIIDIGYFLVFRTG